LTSLTLQTAILTGQLEWEDWEPVPGTQVPTRESVEKIVPGYYDRYDWHTVKNMDQYVATLRDRFQQRVDFLTKSDVTERSDLLARLLDALKVNI
jgi:phosphoenolpyruvate carboxykinase (ATP)